MCIKEALDVLPGKVHGIANELKEWITTCCHHSSQEYYELINMTAEDAVNTGRDINNRVRRRGAWESNSIFRTSNRNRGRREGCEAKAHSHIMI